MTEQHPVFAYLAVVLDQAEAMARAAKPNQWPNPHLLAAWHPRIVLRMVAADRELLAMHAPGLLGECTEDHRGSPCPTVINRAKAWGWDGGHRVGTIEGRPRKPRKPYPTRGGHETGPLSIHDLPPFPERMTQRPEE